MARENRNWHQRFLKYMDMIANHQNYKGLRLDKKADGSYAWIATAMSEIGQQRIKWALDKAEALGIQNQPGVYADVMLAIHPTKWKVCQTCGREMSLYYHYPNANFVKSLNKQFNSAFSTCDHISDIWDELTTTGTTEADLVAFLIFKGGLNLNPGNTEKEELIDALEYICRKGNKNCLGPGAMSNFPDRYDGFHTYNRCCRASQDKGRSKENLKSYTKDRRAYEYWSDGNIHAANQFMGSSFFRETTADHIGPISLGFVHDPHYLQPMDGSPNSAKRDRLQLVDIIKIIETAERTGVYPMSWYSKDIWEYIKANYDKNLGKIEGPYREVLKRNMSNFIYVLYNILQRCPDRGEDFLVEAFLQPHYRCFDFTYVFNDKGEIVDQKPRHYTGRSVNEADRYRRIAIQAVYDYQEKDNRNIEPDLTNTELSDLYKICEYINAGMGATMAKRNVIEFMKRVQARIISKL